MEAKELARRADIRQTAKSTHLNLDNNAEVLAGLPFPFESADVDYMHYVCDSGGTLA